MQLYIRQIRMSCRKTCVNCDAENVKTGFCGYCRDDLCEKCCREDFEDADSCCSNDAFDWCCKECEMLDGEEEEEEEIKYTYDDCGVKCRINPEDQSDFQPCEPYCLNCGHADYECDCDEYEEGRWFNETINKWVCGKVTFTGRKFILKIKNGKVVSKTQI